MTWADSTAADIGAMFEPLTQCVDTHDLAQGFAFVDLWRKREGGRVSQRAREAARVRKAAACAEYRRRRQAQCRAAQSRFKDKRAKVAKVPKLTRDEQKAQARAWLDSRRDGK